MPTPTWDTRRRTTVGVLAALCASACACFAPWHSHSAVARGLAGVVFDSIGLAPLESASVEVVEAGHPNGLTSRTLTDVGGAFALPDLAPGKYFATFYHRRLDSLRLRAATMAIEVPAERGAWIELTTPSVASVYAGVCAGAQSNGETGVLLGRALDANTRAPANHAVVTARWSSVQAGVGGVYMTPVSVTAAANDDGEFALCGLPVGADAAVSASLGNAYTDPIRVSLASSGVVARDLFLAEPRPVVVRGHVLASNGAPISRAHIAVIGGSEAVADDNGVFTLVVAHPGTQTLLTRAIGYFPDERAVDVLTASSPWIEIDLPTAASVLDTVRIHGVRLRDLDHTGFETRRAEGVGVFFSHTDLQAARVESLSELLLRSAPRAKLSNGHTGLSVRGQPCLPTLVLDGQLLPLVEDINDIDQLVDLAAIREVEIYAAGEIPPAFQGWNVCAAVAVWTRR